MHACRYFLQPVVSLLGLFISLVHYVCSSLFLELCVRCVFLSLFSSVVLSFGIPLCVSFEGSLFRDLIRLVVLLLANYVFR